MIAGCALAMAGALAAAPATAQAAPSPPSALAGPAAHSTAVTQMKSPQDIQIFYHLYTDCLNEQNLVELTQPWYTNVGCSLTDRNSYYPWLFHAS